MWSQGNSITKQGPSSLTFKYIVRLHFFCRFFPKFHSRFTWYIKTMKEGWSWHQAWNACLHKESIKILDDTSWIYYRKYRVKFILCYKNHQCIYKTSTLRVKSIYKAYTAMLLKTAWSIRELKPSRRLPSPYELLKFRKQISDILSSNTHSKKRDLVPKSHWHSWGCINYCRSF